MLKLYDAEVSSRLLLGTALYPSPSIMANREPSGSHATGALGAYGACPGVFTLQTGRPVSVSVRV